MSKFSELAAQERAKRDLLLSKAADCDKRAQAYDLLAATEGDELDAAIDNAVVKAAPVAKAGFSFEHTKQSPPKSEGTVLTAANTAPEDAEDSQSNASGYMRKNSVAPDVMRYLADGEKQFDEVFQFAKTIRPSVSVNGVRTLLWSLKKNNFVANPKQGYYVLTDLGNGFIDGLKNAVNGRVA